MSSLETFDQSRGNPELNRTNSTDQGDLSPRLDAFRNLVPDDLNQMSYNAKRLILEKIICIRERSDLIPELLNGLVEETKGINDFWAHLYLCREICKLLLLPDIANNPELHDLVQYRLQSCMNNMKTAGDFEKWLCAARMCCNGDSKYDRIYKFALLNLNPDQEDIAGALNELRSGPEKQIPEKYQHLYNDLCNL